ncbi:DsbC family protein [Nitrincola alkalilacustris]|uniref:DsbC family protein n=1 Tax=Nitrincola alkalilacustris TaxID=1571224 RepID=UPI00124D94D0|nr:DsbC family protein [Nitrincola alkalilacustris]
MNKLMLAAVLLVSLVGNTAMAVSDEVRDVLVQQLQKVDSRLLVKSIQDSALPGLYEVVLEGGDFLYMDQEGKHFVVGHLYEINDDAGMVNLTEKAQDLMRVEVLSQVPASEQIIYPAQGERKATILVFTDVDCPYCRRIHEEIPELSKMGVQVNYLAFPRGGPNTATYNTMVSIWCGEGDERNELMDKVKGGLTISNKSCDNAVLDQFRVGQSVGVTGTPAIVLENGALLPGYMPAARLAQVLGIN